MLNIKALAIVAELGMAVALILLSIVGGVAGYAAFELVKWLLSLA